MNKKPERTCAICRTKKPKNELFRFSFKEDNVLFDKEGNLSGRGFYICSKDCWDMGRGKSSRKSRGKKIKVSSRQNKYISLPDIDFDEIIG